MYHNKYRLTGRVFNSNVFIVAKFYDTISVYWFIKMECLRDIEIFRNFNDEKSHSLIF